MKELKGPRSFEGPNLPAPCYRAPFSVLLDTSLKAPVLLELLHSQTDQEGKMADLRAVSFGPASDII